jgi:nicotinamidase-related amidase
MWGPTIPELTEALPGISIIKRTTVNAFDEPRFAKAVEATGRKKLVIAGVSTEVCLAFPAIFATGIGYDAYAVIDASGTFSETKRITSLLRMVQAGVIRHRLCDRRRGNAQRQCESEGGRSLCGSRYAVGRPGWTIGRSIRQGPRRLQ